MHRTRIYRLRPVALVYLSLFFSGWALLAFGHASAFHSLLFTPPHYRGSVPSLTLLMATSVLGSGHLQAVPNRYSRCDIKQNDKEQTYWVPWSGLHL